jgi:hypothetical protein
MVDNGGSFNEKIGLGSLGFGLRASIFLPLRMRAASKTEDQRPKTQDQRRTFYADPT